LVIELGKALFHEKALSGNQTRSCVSCHNPAQFFSDGLVTSLSLDGKNARRSQPPDACSTRRFSTPNFMTAGAKVSKSKLTFVLQNPREIECESRFRSQSTQS
jgi:cytochrome c peroxidase